MRINRLGMWLFVCAVWLWAATAIARPTVAVMPFSGDESVAAAAESAVVDLLDHDYDVVAEKRTWAAMDKVGAKRVTDRALRDLAAELKVDAVISGRAQKVGGRTELFIKVRRRSSDDIHDIVANYKQFSAIDVDLRAKLRAAITSPTSDAPSTSSTTEVTYGLADPPASQDADGLAKPKSSVNRGLARAAVRATLGVGTFSRTLTFANRAAFIERPPGYKSSFIGAARFDVDVYPLALVAPRAIWSGLGVHADLERAMSLTTSIAGVANTIMPTTQQNWNVGLRMRVVLGKGANASSLVLGAGYGVMRFHVDRSGLPAGVALDMPSTRYVYVDARGGARIGLGPVGVSLFGRGVFPSAAGAITLPNEYGAARIVGFGGRAGLDYAIGSWVLDLSLAYTTLGLSFNGTGQQTFNRDGVASTVDITGATDALLTLMLAVGVAL